MAKRLPEEIKHRRDVYLQLSDLYVLPDKWEYLNADEKAAWRDYRQALRDIPQQPEFPDTLVWPQPPKGINFNVPADDEWPPEWI